MEDLIPNFQRFDDLRDGTTICVTKVTLVSASDTITVPTLANTTASASSAQVRAAGEVAATVTDDGANTVTIVGVAGDKATIATLHGPANVNFGSEA